jgi:hypothetical protein
MLIQHQYVWLKEQTLEQAITSSGDGLNPELKEKLNLVFSHFCGI